MNSIMKGKMKRELKRNLKASKLLATAISISILAISKQGFAEDIEVSSTIESATVFGRGAEVNRGATVNIPAGSHRLIFTDLPAYIDPARLQLSVGSNAIRLANIQLEEIHAGQLVSDQEQLLQEQLENLLFDREAISDEILSAQTQLTLLNSLATGAVGGKETSLNGSELTELLSSLSTNSASARLLIREANQRIRSLDAEVEQKRFELSQIATDKRSQNVLTVAVDATVATQTDLNFSYPIGAAQWQWLYEARLDTDTKRMDIKRKVSVSQSSGEDWNDIKLNISTSRPQQETQTPELNSLQVDLRKPIPPRVRAQSQALERSPRLESADGVEEVIVTGSFIRGTSGYASSMKVVSSAYQMDFDVPGSIDIPANGQQRILPVDERFQPVDLVVRTVPEQSLSAFLEARFTYNSDLPLLAGEMQFYRDGTFIGSGRIDTFMPNEEISLAFGQDDRVRIEIRNDEEESRGGSTFRRNAVEDSRTRYLVTNFHQDAIDVEVLSRIPVAQNREIDVVINNAATPATESDVDDKAGVLMWKVKAEPSEVAEIKHYFEVRYPEDERLQYR